MELFGENITLWAFLFILCIFCFVLLRPPWLSEESKPDTRSHLEKAKDAMKRAENTYYVDEANYWYNKAQAHYAAAKAEEEINE